ncbi:hypothetical protein AB0I10_14445 [Streptomyces sp. NPDC050636]|uniref:hypothetical protein n=1 Tax=Streptomyces sp. NPDC050636 TaxID=3154510 RepID=UPI0034380DD4
MQEYGEEFVGCPGGAGHPSGRQEWIWPELSYLPLVVTVVLWRAMLHPARPLSAA